MQTIDNYIKTPIEIENHLLKFFNRTDKIVILDIGACEGEDSIRYSNFFPESKIFAFEPLPSNYEKIKANLKIYNKKNVVPLNFALANMTGKSNFFISSGHPDFIEKNPNWDYGNKSSSLLTPEKVLTEYPWLKFNTKIEVNTRTLQSFCEECELGFIDFVHMDVQGAELLVLKGAGVFIEKIKLIWIEVEAIELYKNQPLKTDIEDFMRRNQFIKAEDKVNNISGDQLYYNSRHFDAEKTSKSSNLFLKKFKNIKNQSKVFGSNSNVNVIENYQSKYGKTSFSQSGEDLIVDFIFENIGMNNPSYLDIGAHHPYYLSNTAYFYHKGCQGINVEPDSVLFEEFVKDRKRDINLNVGVADSEKELDFYCMSVSTLNTFSKEEVERIERETQYKLIDTKKIKVDTIVNIISKYSSGLFPDFLSLDVEGYSEQIIRSMQYLPSLPKVICIETISYSEKGRGVKDEELIRLLIEKDYMVYADTFINTIFVERKSWLR